jgi:hypothetical protein
MSLFAFSDWAVWHQKDAVHLKVQEASLNFIVILEQAKFGTYRCSTTDSPTGVPKFNWNSCSSSFAPRGAVQLTVQKAPRNWTAFLHQAVLHLQVHVVHWKSAWHQEVQYNWQSKKPGINLTVILNRQFGTQLVQYNWQSIYKKAPRNWTAFLNETFLAARASGVWSPGEANLSIRQGGLYSRPRGLRGGGLGGYTGGHGLLAWGIEWLTLHMFIFMNIFTVKT